MRHLKRWFLLGAGVALLALTAARAEEKPKPKEKLASTQPALLQAAQAYHLAMQAEQRRSPILMLAAIELLADLKEARGYLGDVKSSVEGGKGKSERKPLSTDIKEWAALAREYAKPATELSEFIEKRLEKLTGRGLIYVQGKDLKTIDYKDTKFKVIQASVLEPGQYYQASNVRFDANKPAAIVLIYEPSTSLDFKVIDATADKPPVGVSERAEGGQFVFWTPKELGPHTITVTNNGEKSAKFVVLVNWDN